MTATAHGSDARHPAWMTWPLLAALAVLVTASLSSSVLSDPDTMWHIAAGRWIVEHRALPMRDMFSWTMPGTPWTAHEWLSELLLFGAWSVAGFPGVVVLSASCFALTAALITRFLSDRLEPQHLPPVALLFLGLIGTHYLARPHVLVWPIMALWIATLVAAVDAKRPPPWWLLGLLVLWVNLHASFTLGLGLAAGLALDAVAQAPDTATRMDRLRSWGLFGLGCLVAAALNPNGLGTLQHAVHMMRMKEMLALIEEWKSADFHQFQLILLWMVLVIGLALLGRLRLSPVRTLLVLGLLYMALKHGRYHSTLGLASVFLLATPLAEALHLRRTVEPVAQADAIDAVMARLMAPTRTAAVVGAVLLAAAALRAGHRWLPDAPPPGITPARALAAYEATGQGRGRLLNGYAFGGFLLFRGVPVFVDGRADMYGDPFLRAMADALTMKEPHGFERYLDRFGVTWTLLAPKSAAVELLDHLPAWQRVYGDSVAVVHVRRQETAQDETRGATPPAPLAMRPTARR